MYRALVHVRNVCIAAIYKAILKPIFFRFDPEDVHDYMTRVGTFLGRYALTRAVTGWLFDFRDVRLSQTIHGIEFANPIGLAAGFDKNAELTQILPAVGFGFAELGSITGEPCSGNPQPRLWRLPRSRSLVVYYGLKNDGCEAIAAQLAGRKFRIPYGVSVAFTNCAENMDTARAVTDYAKAFRTMESCGAYVTVNVSCPNTQGGSPFMQPTELEKLLSELDKIPTQKPVFIKLSPDISTEQLDQLLDIARKHRVHGIIATNLTKKRDNPAIHDRKVPEKGGLSGKVVQAGSDNMIAHIYRREGKRFVIIGVGGVFTPEDAYRKIRLGASLVQLITGMIYQGPQAISAINAGLTALLEMDGFTHISQAIGVDAGV